MKIAGNQVRRAEGKRPRTSFADSILTGLRTLFRKSFGAIGRGRGEHRMELLETLQLGGRRQLMLVVCDGQRFLVGAAVTASTRSRTWNVARIRASNRRSLARIYPNSLRSPLPSLSTAKWDVAHESPDHGAHDLGDGVFGVDGTSRVRAAGSRRAHAANRVAGCCRILLGQPGASRRAEIDRVEAGADPRRDAGKEKPGSGRED